VVLTWAQGVDGHLTGILERHLGTEETHHG
jgi:hypothetical protein